MGTVGEFDDDYRAKRPARNWTDDDDRLLADLIHNGASLVSICEQIGASKNMVVRRRDKLGLVPPKKKVGA